MKDLCINLKQGDFSFQNNWFVFRNHPDDSPVPLLEERIEGILILSQTCDIVRSIEIRPYLEVCPLVRISEVQQYSLIKKGTMPRYVFVPVLQEQKLVGDLDRVMTVSKSLALNWSFSSGLNTVEDERNFALSLARKRNRFAFPDELVELLRPMQKKIIDKHNKSSDEGLFLSSIQEMRVIALPSWESDLVTLEFYFLFTQLPNSIVDKNNFDRLCQKYIDLVRTDGRYIAVDYTLAEYSEISALEYIRSVPLDLEYLSME